MDTMFWGVLQRITECLLDGGPTMLAGLLIAASLRHFLGSDGLRELFGNNSRRSLWIAWLLGMLLPVCSLGVIPLAMEMRRAGIRQGTILAFALTAPLFNPLSLLYGLTLAAPLLVCSFALASLLLVTVVGMAWDRSASEVFSGVEPFPASRPGWTRIALVALSSARLAVHPLLLYASIGIIASAALSGLLPKGSLSQQFAQGDPWSPLMMAAIALPLYTTPLTVMSQIGSMFIHANSMGAAYVLLALGTGCNVGLLAWTWRTWGARSTLCFLAICLTGILALGYTMHASFHAPASMEHPHTHAFDNYSQPFAAGERMLPQRVADHLREEAQPYQYVALGLLAAIIGAGVFLRVVDPRGESEGFLQRRAESTTGAGRYDMTLSQTTLKWVLSAGMVAASVLSCYIYFPESREVLEEMRVVRADALSAAVAGHAEESLRQISLYDDLTRRLQVGHYLRTGQLSEYQRAKATVLREQLERLKDDLEAGRRDRVRQRIVRISDAHSRLRAAFLP